jgi:RND family efflux transporter, MFP subunit
MKIKRFFQIVIGVVIISAIVGILFSNKNKLDEKAERSLKGNTEIPVNVSYPQFTSVGSDVNITGTIVSENEVLIVSKAQGIVLSKYKKAGEWVTKGMLIAKIEDNVIYENLRLAELNFAKALKDVERYHSLVAVDAVTKTEVENVEIAMRNAESVVIELKEQLKNTQVTAPATGVLEKDFFEAGSLVAPGTLMGEIVDTRNLKVTTTVTGKDMLRLKKGDAVIITVDIFPDMAFEGEIGLIGSKSDESMTYTLEAFFKTDYSDLLKPGMYAQINTKRPEQEIEKILTIERACIVGSIKNPSVYIVQDGKAYLKEITVGKVIDNRIEIIGGITAESIVVNSGQINLTNGCTVTIL